MTNAGPEDSKSVGISRPLRVAFLCHYPECLFESHDIEFDRERAAPQIRHRAFSNIEGVFLDGLAEQEGLELEVLTFSQAIQHKQSVRCGPNLRLHLFPAKRFTGMSVGWCPRVLAARRFLAGLQVDLVHGFRCIEGYGLMAVCSGLPHLVTPEEFFANIPAPAYMKWSMSVGRSMEKLTFRRASHIMAISKHVRRQIEPTSSARFYEIPNIAADVFYLREKASPSGVLYVGRISPEKRLMDLLKGLKIATEKGVNIPARIAGGPSGKDGATYLRECEHYARRELAPGQVEFLGWKTSDEIAELHARTSMFVMPSLADYEGMPVVLAESLAAGTPAIVYDHGPMPEMVKDGVTGRVVPPGDVDGLADAMVALISNRTNLEGLSENARSAGQRFRRSVVVQQLVNAYRTILSPSFEQ